MIISKDKTLTIDNIAVQFTHSIENIIECNNGIIVRLGSFTDIEQNIYFVNLDGTIKWQIEHLGLPEKAGYQGYTHAAFDKEGVLEVYSFRGVTCKVDIETGKIYNCVGEK